jgi:tetratricopeptide (TPR) repeat protein
VAEGCFVFHYGGRTFAGMGLEGEKFDAVMRANQQRYEDKWGFKLPPNLPPDRLARDLNRRAREALARGDAAEAVRHLRAAVAAAPNDSRHHSDLGAALWQLDRRELAFACFLQALRCDVADPDALANARDAARALGREAELDAALANGD